MLTYDLKKAPGLPLYEDLYRRIRQDILDGNLKPGEKLPSKRTLAQNLEVGKTTVEAAYGQLLSEGYIRSQEKVGFFVEELQRSGPTSLPVPAPGEPPAPKPLLDLTANGTGHFPFSVWIRLQREVILDYGKDLLLPMPNQGIPELRQAIAGHLGAFRGMAVDPECILIGAGTDFLYNLLIQLLGQDKVFAVEEPGYRKIRRIYAAGGVTCISAPMDENGVRPDCLDHAQVLHISPSHHFPTGLVTPVNRRRELLDWAARADRWIIEDDYDTEFRFQGRPKPAMCSMDPERVIYMNSFSKSLAPSIRISYAILPQSLLRRFREKLGFYGCTVPSFEQYTLARFLSRGYFEKHINRMRKFYQARRNRVIRMLETSSLAPRLTILEQDAGLHFLVRVDTELSDQALVDRLEEAGIRVQTLSSFYAHPNPDSEHCLVVNYSGMDEEALARLLPELEGLFDEKISG